MAASRRREKSSNSEECWSPSSSYAFHILIVVRFISAFYNNISDCDETFNYWEPAHFLMHGTGFQTWEYSPVYAIRSYTYLLLHVIPLFIIGTINKIVQFYALRVLLAFLCSVCETYFYRAITRKFGSKVGLLTLVFLALSNGMFIASTAFLPSSFTMYCGMVAMAAWFQGQEKISIFAVAFGSIVGWPFFAVLGIPIALDVVFRQRRVVFFCFWTILSFILIAVPTVCIDSWFYGKPVLASLNIIMYNIFSKGGSTLYGTEPWTFYFANGFLAFNCVFLLSLITWPLMELKFVLVRDERSGGLQRMTLLPMLLWMAIFFTRPHKEERFLFPIYPLICLTAAMSVSFVQELLSLAVSCLKLGSLFRTLVKWTPVLVAIIHSLLGISRSLSLHYNYQAPLQVYTVINSQPVLSFTGYTKEINVCVGKEWYRFTSNYFLPDRFIQPLRNRWHLRFLQSDFKGQLPKLFSEGQNATSIIPTNMNDMNKEEPSRYFDVDKCHFLVDLELSTFSKHEPHYSKRKEQWEILYSFPFLDATKTSSLERAFYIPGIGRDKEKYGRYLLLRNKKGNFIKEYKDMPK